MADKLWTTEKLARCVGIIALLGFACLVFVPDARVAVLRFIFPGVCVTEDKGTMPNVAGMEFKIVYENCDTLAKEEEVRVYVSRAAENGDWFFTRWLNRRTLLFSYDPGGVNDVPLPSIHTSGAKRILISIPRVSEVLFQSRKWRDVSVDYDIGHIEYP